MFKNWKNIGLRILIAATLATIISVLFIEKQYPYDGKVVNQFPYNLHTQRHFLDLNQDGLTESISFYQKTRDLTEVVFHEWDQDLVAQVNIKGNLIPRAELLSGDYNKDGYLELYLFTFTGDSLFLNVIDTRDGKPEQIRRKNIPGSKLLNGEAAYLVNGGLFEDENGDGLDEIYFLVHAGFTLRPRNLYCYYVHLDSLLTSPPASSGPKQELEKFDLDQDGTSEFWASIPSPGNFSDTSLPYSDQSSWLMVFSHHLDFEFEPIEFKGFGCYSNPSLLQSDEKNYLAVMMSYRGNDDSIQSEMILVEPGGTIVKRKELSDIKNIVTPIIEGSKIHIFDLVGAREMVLNADLDITEINEKSWHHSADIGQIRFQGEDKVLYSVGRDGFFYLLSPKHTIQARVAGITDPGYIYSISPIHTSAIPNGLHLKGSKSDQSIVLEENPKKYFIYYSGFAIFTSILIFIYLIQFIQIRQERVRRENENLLRTLQLQTLKSQMNPHFIFNALNSISAMYMKGYSEKAEKFLVRFSRMIREVVDSSDKTAVTLKEEMEFVLNYLKLEQIRYGENFSFNIAIPGEYENIRIPSLCIHAFVENSVKHAFPDKTRPMEIHIGVREEHHQIFLTVSDNGTGFRKEEKPARRTGQGLRLVREMLENYNKVHGTNIRYTIRQSHPETLTDMGAATGQETKLDTGQGTLVEIIIG